MFKKGYFLNKYTTKYVYNISGKLKGVDNVST